MSEFILQAIATLYFIDDTHSTNINYSQCVCRRVWRRVCSQIFRNKYHFMGFRPYMAPKPFFCPLLIKCNLTLLKASGARDIQSTTTMLICLVYFLSTQSKVGIPNISYTSPLTPPSFRGVGGWGVGYIPKNNAKGAESLVFFFNRKMEVQNQIRGGK